MKIETFKSGDKIELGPRQVTRNEIIDFASKFDQAPFHLDEEAAKKSMLGGLCASGWHTSSLSLRLMHDACFKFLPYETLENIEDCKWHKPVYVDDTLSGSALVEKAITTEKSHIVSFNFDIRNQNNDLVHSMKVTAIFSRQEPENA